MLSALVWVLGTADGRRLRVTEDRITVSTVRTGQFEDFIPVRGRVVPLRTIYLDAIEGGRVEQVLVEDGALVSAGQPLVVLSNTALQLDVIAREAQVAEQLNNIRTLELQLEQNRIGHKRELVEADYQITRLTDQAERRRALVKRAAVSKEEVSAIENELTYWQRRRAVTREAQATDEKLQRAQVEQLRTAGDRLRSNLEVARKNLDSLNVRAPVAGKLTALNAEVGQSLSRGERIGQIDHPTEYKISALVDEFYLPRIDVGQTATLNVSDRDYALTLEKIYPQVNNGEFEIDLIIQGRQPDGMRRGQTLQMRLTLGDPTETMLLPNGAFYQDTGGSWVFVVLNDESAAVRRTVRLGRRNAQFIEVLEGLDDGEKVITSPYTSYLDMDRLVFDN